MPIFLPRMPFTMGAYLCSLPKALISTSTPAGRSSFMSASMVCGVGSSRSRRRLWVRISNCSRLFLSTCGERSTVKRLMAVGKGMGPAFSGPGRGGLWTFSWWRRRGRACRRLSSGCGFSLGPWFPSLLHNLGDGAGADGAAAFADGEAQALLHRHRGDELDGEGDVVARHHHLGARGQLRHPGHVGGAHVELRPVPLEEGRVPPPLLLGQHVDLGLELGV